MSMLFAKALATPPILFADEQPQRLCQQRPPHGLLGSGNHSGVVLLSECVSLVTELQASARNGSTRPALPDASSSCAVVGNSGTLFESGLGRHVDSHAHVLRFNAAPSGGVWEHDVGQKSTVRILSAWVAQMRTRHPADTRSSGDAVLLYCRLLSYKCLRAAVSPPGKGQLVRRWLVNPLFVAEINAELHRLQDELHQHEPQLATRRSALPSTGIVGVALALSTCARVSLLGFGNASAASPSSSACSPSPGPQSAQ